MNRDELIEKLSAEIHKCYCRAYERRFGKPYWTNGDYSELDEPTKDYDREIARFVIADRKRIVEPLVRYKKRFPDTNRKIKCIDETLHLALGEDKELR